MLARFPKAHKPRVEITGFGAAGGSEASELIDQKAERRCPGCRRKHGRGSHRLGRTLPKVSRPKVATAAGSITATFRAPA